jgi:hypothetical protein
MTTINRTVETEQDRLMAARLIEARAVPFTLSLTDGKHRTTAQNKLQRLWMNEISQQRGDLTPEEARAYCKLTIGVPILRAENEAFRIRYDEVVKPLPYEQKIAIMAEPLDLPVTRLMTTKQKTDYLDGIVRHFAEQGIVLTMPEDMKHESGSSPHPEPDTADAPAPERSAEGVDPSPSTPSPIADAPVSEARPDDAEAEAADATAPNAPAASTSENEVLIRFAADLLPKAANSEISTGTLKAIEKRWIEGAIAGLSDDGKDTARLICATMRNIANGKVKLKDEAAELADVLGCSPSDIGG